MRLILAGGGQPSRTSRIDRFAVGLIGGGRVLFLPHAIAPGEWKAATALQWLLKSPAWRRCEVHMWQRLSSDRRDRLDSFDAIYLMGGQPLVLRDRLRRAKLLDLLDGYIRRGGLVFGLSAGAILLGHDLGTAALKNGRESSSSPAPSAPGMDCLRGHNICPHFNARLRSTLREHVRRTRRPVFAVPETSALYVTRRYVGAIGERPIELFSRGRERTIEIGRRIPW